jgi:glycosyltransferase involved in cell wall biosynthesis
MARICVIRHWYYPNDPRVHREIDALRRAGHEVDLICAGQPGQPNRERQAGLSIWRIPLARHRGSLPRYLYEYGMFLIVATVLAGLLFARHRHAIVQVNSLPDWLVFAAAVPKLFGARIVLDLHECMPEYFTTKYKLPLGHPVVRVLMLLEQASIRFASYVITCTDQMRERFIERGAPGDKIGVVLNACDEDRFDPNGYEPPRREGGHFELICHGTIDENYGLDVVVRAVALLRDRIPGLHLGIYGDGTARSSVEALAKELGLEDRVSFSRGWLKQEELLRRIAEADAGVVAIRRDAFRDLTHCNKMYDLVAMKRPVIISRTRAVEAYFGDECFQLFESGNEVDLARAIHEVYADPELRQRLVSRATEVGEPYRWVHQAREYVGMLERSMRGKSARPRRLPDVGKVVKEQ